VLATKSLEPCPAAPGGRGEGGPISDPSATIVIVVRADLR
jgi:hypothetical protein